MNWITLTGRIVQDLELKETSTGKKYCKFRIAVVRNKDVSDFFTCTAWEKTAETIVNYCSKGKMIAVGGQMFNVSWQTQDGQNRRDNEVQVREFDFLFEKSKASAPKVEEQKEEQKEEQTAPDMDQMTFEDGLDLPFEI